MLLKGSGGGGGDEHTQKLDLLEITAKSQISHCSVCGKKKSQ